MASTTANLAFENYLHFNGNAREAFEFYRSVFGGELFLRTWNESPMPDRPGDPDPDRIMHARLEMSGAALMGCDTPPEMFEAPQGFRVAISAPDVENGKRFADALGAGGEIVMPFGETFWSPGFGMVNDRFGTPWMINVDAGTPPRENSPEIP